MKRRGFLKNLFIMMAALLIVVVAQPSVNQVFAQQKNVILATTTSTQDSGLDVLIPVLRKRQADFVKTIAVSSGQAMAMGQKGEADVLLVHSPDAEKSLLPMVLEVNRRLVMHKLILL